VVGSVNADITFTVEALPGPGQTVLASAVASAPGGKGGNQAVAAARAGADVALVAAVGTDGSADMLITHLEDNGVDVSPVQRVPGASGSAAIIVDARAENCIVVAPGANGHLGVGSPALRSTIAERDVVLISLEIPMDTAIAAAGIGREGGAVVIVNASPTVTDPHHRRQLADHADVIVVNDTEAADWDDAGVDHLVVTRGARGARHLHDGVTTDVPAPRVEAVDTTGAGDVFAGVLAASWPAGPEQALRRGCAAGALATLVPGAGDCAPSAEAIDDVLAAH